VKKLITVVAGIALAAGLGAGLAAHSTVAGNGTNRAASGHTVNGLDSLNWAGYVDTHANESVASANWTVPSVWGANGWSSSWVGLDGDGSPTVEQTGTDSGLVYGAPIYLAWVELYPAPPVVLPENVYPGDKMSGSVRPYEGFYRIYLADHTRGWHISQTVYVRGGRNASAEVITEAPSSASTGNILPLADFGSVHFTDVDISGHATRMNMVARNWRVKASVTGSQQNFTVHFRFAGLAP